MAKASPEDFQRLLDFLTQLEEKVDDWTDDCELGEWVNRKFPNVSTGWRRVVWGYNTLESNAADPDLSYLDWTPYIKTALDYYERHHPLVDQPQPVNGANLS